MYPLRRTIPVFAVVLSLLAPVMACAVPSAQMTTSEQACCKQMHGKCGSMPMRHSCCKSTADKSDLPATQAVAPLQDTHVTAVAIVAFPVSSCVPVFRRTALDAGFSESPPSFLATSRQTVILRI